MFSRKTIVRTYTVNNSRVLGGDISIKTAFGFGRSKGRGGNTSRTVVQGALIFFIALGQLMYLRE
jgi:hypothetical protein